MGATGGIIQEDSSVGHCFLLRDLIQWTLFKLGFTPWKAEQSLQGTKLQEKEPQKD